MAALSAAVVGPGGVGGLLGGLLVRAGARVEFVAGERTAEALRAGGLSVRSVKYGDFTVPVAATTELSGPVDVCFVTTKATSLEAALERVPPGALGDGLVVPLLNGFEHMAVLRRRYPAEQVVAGVVRVESARTAPGRIEHTSPFLTFELGSATAPEERVAELAARLREAGLEVTVRDDETVMLWDKLTFLAAFALLTTCHMAPAGVVRTEHRDELVAVLREITAVAAAEGAVFDPDGILAFFDGLPPQMKSSMQRDAEAGRPTELDALGGAVLRAAERHGVAAPAVARLVAELAAREPAQNG
jgi:2-dehydropantoate 2-reductase